MKLNLLVLGLLLAAGSLHAQDQTHGVKLKLFGYGVTVGAVSPAKKNAATNAVPDTVPTYRVVTAASDPASSTVAAATSTAPDPDPAFRYAVPPDPAAAAPVVATSSKIDANWTIEPVQPAPAAVATTVAPAPAPAPQQVVAAPAYVAPSQPTYVWTQQAQQSAPVTTHAQYQLAQASVQQAPQVTVTRIYPVRRIQVASYQVN